MILAYLELNKSQTSPPQSCIAAKRLAIAQVLIAIWYLIGITLYLIITRTIGLPEEDSKSIIEFIMFVKLVLPIIAYILVITGWAKIKKTDPQNYPESCINT
jgi:hypothetical protein